MDLVKKDWRLKSINEQSPNKRINTIAEVVFGTPNRDCQGYGICKVIAFSQHFSCLNICKHAPATITLLTSDKLQFKFDHYQLRVDIAQRYFNKVNFLVYEKFIFPRWLNDCFEVKKGVINPGEYPIVRDEDKAFIIEFDIMTQ